MKTYFKSFKIHTISGRPSYHDIRDTLIDIANESEIQTGILLLQTPHTTCSFYYEETMHDKNFYGDEYLQVDINETMNKIIPKMETENQYHSPGPEHVAFGLSLSDPNYPAEKWVMLNTDAHIRSSIFGTNSMSLIMHENKLQLGSLGRVYFVDWDQLRERDRTIQVLIMGEE